MVFVATHHACVRMDFPLNPMESSVSLNVLTAASMATAQLLKCAHATKAFPFQLTENASPSALKAAPTETVSGQKSVTVIKGTI